MAWKYTLNIGHEWQQAKQDKISPKELAKTIAEKLKKIKLSDSVLEEEKNELIEEFECFSDEDTVAYFDLLMERLYDLADEARIWVVTNVSIDGKLISST